MKMAKVSLSGFTFSGESRAGIGTAMVLKELKICFDLGALSHSVLSSSNIFISHGHTDHCGQLFNYLAIRALENRNMATIFVPPELGTRLPPILSAWQEMSESKFDYRLVLVHPGAPVPLRNKLTVTGFPLAHSPETLGFLVEETVTKLKEQHKSLSPLEIAARRKGDPDCDLFFELKKPLFAYVPDTLPEGLDTLPQEAWNARVLAVEASFLDGRKPVEKVRKGRHLLLNDIVERLSRFQGDNILLFHFSKIYRTDEIETIVSQGLPAEWRHRVHCFI